jgi:hypothetical protein
MALTLEQINSPDYLKQLRAQAETQLAPTRDLALNQIQLEEQGLGNQEKTINRGADTLAEELRKGAETSNKSLTENFNNLGLLQSGLTAAGLGDIQVNLNKGIKETEQDRADRLADIALQRAGLGIKRTQVQQSYGTSIDDLVKQLLQGAKDQYKADNAFDTIDLGDKVAFVDQYGNVKKTLAKSNGGVGGGLTTSQGISLFDQARKRLQSGESWGSVGNSLRALGIDWNTIDSQLNKDFWSKPGAYKTWQVQNKKPTADQAKVAGFATRLSQANDIIKGLDATKLSLTGQKYLPNVLKNASGQSLDQAQRNFINAVLRRESGAAISPQEFDNAYKQYFPQPGDKASTIKQKQKNRETVINNFLKESGQTIKPSLEDIFK